MTRTQPVYDPESVLRAKQRFLAGSELSGELDNLDLLESWKRSQMTLGRPESLHEVPQVPLDTLDVHLADMFYAPLSRVSNDLAGSGIAVLLADAQGRILQRWSRDSAALRHLDSVGTDLGAVLSEDSVGTNGVGTVALTGKALQVRGEEHFVSTYARAVCTGAPVFHPVSGKLLAVVTFSSDEFEHSALLKPLVAAVTDKLERHLLETERPEVRRVLAEFTRTSRPQGGSVLAFGPQGLVVQSRSAQSLTVADFELIESTAPAHRRGDRFVLELSQGNVEVQVRPVSEDDGYIVTLDAGHPSASVSMGPARGQLVGRDPAWLAAVQTVTKHREARRPLLIVGEPSTGKTTVAAGLMYRKSASGLVHATAERHVIGTARWLQQVANRLQAAAPIVIRGVEGLDNDSVDALAALIDRSADHGSILLTMAAESTADAEAMAARLGVAQVWVPALRERPADVPALWRVFATVMAPGADLKPTPAAVELLQSHAWAGNLRELRGIIEQMAMSGKRGAVLPSDLPESLRGTRSLSMIERAELEAIRRALAEANGNRSRAAKILGLSRATIYRKMRAYRLTA